MNATGNTIFITGGNSGIGKGLAEALHKLGNTVIIGGRREEALKSICLQNKGMTYEVLDVADPQSIDKTICKLKEKYPHLNCLINNAGIQRKIDFNQDISDISILTNEIDINIKGVIYMTSAVLPIIKVNPNATIVNISSGLAFIPLAEAPIYSATKSAIHSLSLSLRHQLKGKVEVIEIAPPAVNTNLGKGENFNNGPKSLEVSEFIEKTLKALLSGQQEIIVSLAKTLSIGSRLAPNLLFSLINK